MKHLTKEDIMDNKLLNLQRFGFVVTLIGLTAFAALQSGYIV